MRPKLGSKYFLTGTCLGLMVELLVAAALIGNGLEKLFSFSTIVVAIVVGALTMLAVAVVLDRKWNDRISLLRTCMGAGAIFIVGSLVGLLVSLALNGSWRNPSNGYFDELMSWFLAPGYWLAFIGIPLSQILAAIYYPVYRVIFRKI